MIVTVIVVVMLWYSFRSVGTSTQYLKKLQEKERIEIRADVKTVNLNSIADKSVYYLDVVYEKNAVDRYKQIVKDYEAGLIDRLEFQNKTAPLINKINIKDIH